jgi:glycosyltransferase involved in cell wall biosynthesis
LKIAFVIQRYGLDVSGGSELHCRSLAEHLQGPHSVEVFTTVARDWVEWGDPGPEGTTLVRGIPVHRFKTRRRTLRTLAALSERVFSHPHTGEDEAAWFRENGPLSEDLVAAVEDAKGRFDWFFFYSFRYYQVFAGLPRVREKAILVPTAEDDPALTLGAAQELLRAPRGLLYLTPEEQTLVEQAAGNEAVPSEVIGTGLDPASPEEGLDARARFGLARPFLLYVGRIDRNKGCPSLFSHFLRLSSETDLPFDLVLAGKEVIEVPKSPKIRALGLVSEAEKVALLRAATLLVMPSFLESLSIILLEAWREGLPALVNGRCAVLEGQARRSNGGLYYRGYEEFRSALLLLLGDAELRKALGERGREYVEREYGWERVLGKVGGLLRRLGAA